ncbi:prepronociceptin [Eublepharis macularius]|uniref:Prepronociceptin n=1 Tax=Eublepharis macularius TaxID=481883 RepID=A0AA97KKG0_EUBMA|nr:prepronociceptin [Eublepharis macularius]
MRILLWGIWLFSLLAYALSDCRRDCLNCHRHLYSHQDDFSLLICVMECEGKLFSSATWGICSKATGKATLPGGLDNLEAAANQPLEMWDGSLFRGRGNIRHLGDLTRRVDLSKAEDEKQVSKVSGLVRQPEAEEGASDGSQAPLGELQDQFEIPKRLGGFLSGPFGFGQVAEPAVQELQKRYGGFIGVRKSARKWHNQKRFSEFLKQYLGMSPRSVEYDGFADDLKEQNEI